MEIKVLDQLLEQEIVTEDSIDIPDCFGEYDKKNRVCIQHCAICIKCCVSHAQHPPTDVLERLLIYNEYSPKPN